MKAKREMAFATGIFMPAFHGGDRGPNPPFGLAINLLNATFLGRRWFPYDRRFVRKGIGLDQVNNRDYKPVNYW
jgi:hypothetical protein